MRSCVSVSTPSMTHKPPVSTAHTAKSTIHSHTAPVPSSALKAVTSASASSATKAAASDHSATSSSRLTIDTPSVVRPVKAVGARRRSMVPNPFESITKVQPSPVDGYCSDSDRSDCTAASGTSAYLLNSGPPSPAINHRPGLSSSSSALSNSLSSPGKLKLNTNASSPQNPGPLFVER